MKKRKQQQLAHLIAGVILILHGFSIFENARYLPATGYLAMGIAFVIVAGVHKSLLQVFMQGDTAIFLLEALMFFLAGYSFKATAGFWHYFFTLLAAVYFIVACFSVQIDKNPQRRSGRRKKRSQGLRSGLEDEFLKAGQKRHRQ